MGDYGGRFAEPGWEETDRQTDRQQRGLGFRNWKTPQPFQTLFVTVLQGVTMHISDCCWYPLSLAG